VKEIHSNMLKHGVQFVSPIVIGVNPSGKMLLIDGMHRRQALRLLSDTTCTVVVCYVSVVDEEDAYHWYKLANGNMPFQTITTASLQTEAKEAVKLLSEYFPGVIKDCKYPRRPRVAQNALMQALVSVMEKSSISAVELVNRICYWNSVNLKADARAFKGICSKKKKETLNDIGVLLKKARDLKCILFMLPLDVVLEKVITGSHLHQERKSFTRRVRRQVWEINNDGLKGKCYTCEELIDIDTFEVGHIVPHALGGSSDITNLRAICRHCNLDMGTRNMEEYKQSLMCSGIVALTRQSNPINV